MAAGSRGDALEVACRRELSCRNHHARPCGYVASQAEVVALLQSPSRVECGLMGSVPGSRTRVSSTPAVRVPQAVAAGWCRRGSCSAASARRSSSATSNVPRTGFHRAGNSPRSSCVKSSSMITLSPGTKSNPVETSDHLRGGGTHRGRSGAFDSPASLAGGRRAGGRRARGSRALGRLRGARRCRLLCRLAAAACSRPSSAALLHLLLDRVAEPPPPTCTNVNAARTTAR
mgnify:CR=1 FL=1